MTNKKLIVNEWIKEYSIIEVSKECFDNSPNIETVGHLTGFKIKSEESLDFRVNELKRLGFAEIIEAN